MYRSIKLLIAGLLVVALHGATPAAAERRVALVIGNSNYAHVAKLANPENDARAVAQTLRTLGFQTVELVINQPSSSLRTAVQRFSREAQNAEVALVFYAGHGIEFGGNNYLIPIDAQIKTDVDVEFETLSLDLVMRSIEGAGRLRVIILDACRDNPFAKRMTITRGATRSAGRGLAQVDPPGDTLVAYAAKAGSTAEDGTGANSPFTTALLQHMATPGLDIRLMFGRVRDTVADLTRRQQEPFVYGSIGGREIYLRPPAGTAAPAAGPPPSPTFDPRALELSFWESVRSSDSPAVIRSYLERYPNGTFAPLARARLQELEAKRLAALPPSPAPQRPSVTPPAPSVAPPVISGPGRGTLRIAVAAPMTGANAAFGAQIKNGVEQSIDDVNGAGGILGQRLVLTVGDDRSDPREGVSVANKLAGDGVRFVVGHFNSGVTIPASEVYQTHGILAITPSATNPRITDRGMWNMFRTCGRDDQQGAFAGEYIAKRFKRVALLHDGTSYGHGLVEQARHAMENGRLKPVLSESVKLGEKDFTALITRLRAANVDLVYWGGLNAEASLIVRQMRAVGIKATFMGGDGIATDEFAAAGGPGVEGALMTFSPDARRRPEAQTVVGKIRARNFEPEGYTLYSYAAVEVIKQAAEAAKSLDAKAVAAQMSSGMRFRTVLGELSFDRKGDITRSDYTVHVWKKDGAGRITYVEME
jgi:branched-chain amino acid transport system substrate-binding protein